MNTLRDSAILAAVIDSGREVEEVTEDRGKALCPFHEEKTPSFVLYGKEDKFVCFGCGASGMVADYRDRIRHGRR